MPWLRRRSVLTNLRGLYYDAVTVAALAMLVSAGWRALFAEIGVEAIVDIAVALAGLVLLGALLVGRRRRAQQRPVSVRKQVHLLQPVSTDGPARSRPCRDCGAPIAFARTATAWLPLDVTPVAPDAPSPPQVYRVDWCLRVPRAVHDQGTARGVAVYVPHFLTCPSRRRAARREAR